MPRAAEALRAGFEARIRPPRVLVAVWARTDRTLLGFALAFGAAGLLFAATLAFPEHLLDELTSIDGAKTTFGRFISGVATASSIAVSVALLAMGRELRGVQDTREARSANESFRETLRSALGRDELPVLLADLVVVSLDGLADAAAEAARAAPLVEVSGMRLPALLGSLEANARSTARHVTRVRAHPDRVHLAFLDHEMVVHGAMIRRALRVSDLPAGARDRLARLKRIHDAVVVTQRYVKTLDFQWGLSRMSHSVLLSAFPAILVAATFSLAYGAPVRDALGATGSAALVCIGLGIVLLPLALFLSHLLRFITLTRYTLSTEMVVLGPDLTHALDAPPPSRGSADRR